MQFSRCSRTADSIKRKFSSLANQQPGTGDPSVPPLVKLAKEIREVMNVKAGVSDADVSDFFVDDDVEEEQVGSPSQLAAPELAAVGGTVAAPELAPVGGTVAAPELAAVGGTVPSAPPSIIVTTRQSTSSGAGSISASVATSKARIQQNKLVGAIESNADATSGAFASFMQQRQMMEEFEWRQRRLEREEERARREEERTRRDEEERTRREEERLRREEELHEMRRKESSVRIQGFAQASSQGT
jgi:hypothetical protein